MTAARDIPDDIKTPYCKSEFEATVEAIRAHHQALGDKLAIISAELRRELRHVKGNPWLLGMDIRLAARKVAKPFAWAAAEEDAIARSAVAALRLFQELFLHQGENKGKGFDITK